MMNATAAPQLFSASEIAAALGLSRFGVHKALGSIAPAAKERRSGGTTALWRAAQLPPVWRDQLAEKARAGGYRNGEHLLSKPVASWQPQIDGAAVQLGDLAEHCIADARRMQNALLPSLLRLTGEKIMPAGEAESTGLAEYRATMGHLVSAHHWRRLINRTVERAGAGQDFTRVELFLPAKLARRVQTPPGYVAAGMHLQNLRLALSNVRRPSEPSAEELVFIWTQAFDEMQWMVDEGAEPKTAARTVFAALVGSGVRLALTLDALKKSFKRKLARFQEGGCKPSALNDGRTLRSLEARLVLPDEDRNVLTARAVERGGRISQAWRDAHSAGELSPEIAGRYIANPASKSYVPAAVRENIRLDVAMLKDIHHGPRQHKLNGPFTPRHYSDIGPGDWSQGDDCTLPAYYWEDTPEGRRAMRGQFLLMLDVKTNLLLGFALISQRNYSAAAIRSLIVHVHDEHGLPRKGFYFEGGIWKRSRLLKGRAVDEITMEETEQGLREFVQFKHAKLPRAKVVEGILGIIQNEIEPLPGYVGRNEQTEKFERIQRQLLLADAGKITLDSFLYSKAQWLEVLNGICERLNNAPQGGRNKGQSPREAYENGFDYQSPLVRLPANCRHLLDNHRRKEKVTKNGVRIVFGGQSYYYRSADTGRMIGREVLVWHDVEGRQESITITDLQRCNPIEVPRVDPLPSMTATAEQLGAAHAQAAAHLSYARTTYRVISPHFERNRFRPVSVDASTLALVEKIEAGRAEITEKKERGRKTARKIAELEQETGRRFPNPPVNLERRLRAMERLKRVDEMERQQKGEIA